MARRASAIEKLRKQNHGTLLLDGGDALLTARTPKPTPQALKKGEVMLRGHGLLGLDAMAIGEAELALGLKRLKGLARKTSQTLLCANLSQRGKPAFAQRKLVQAGPVKVGLTAVLELPPKDKLSQQILRKSGLTLQPAQPALAQQVAKLRQEGAEVLVVLAHTGMPLATQLAKQVKGVHLFLVAHSGQQTSVPLAEGNALLLEPGRRGMNLAHLQLRLGQDWTADSTLQDASTRQVLYDEMQDDLTALKRRAKQHPLRKNDPRLMRTKALRRRYEATKPVTGKNLVVVRMISLGTDYPDNAALKGLMDANRKSWQVPRKRPKRPTSARFRRVPGTHKITLQ